MRSKILTLIVLPVLALLILAGGTVSREWKHYQQSLTDEINGEMIQLASFAIHELQKERGQSGMYLGRELSLEELEKQRLIVDVKLKALSEKAKDPRTDPQLDHQVDSVTSGLQKLRTTVNQKEDIANVPKEFSALIENLILLEVRASRTGTFEDQLTGPIMLDVAKENAGKIRAFLLGPLVSDQPLSMDQFARLQYLMSSIDSNLHSPVLKISQEGTAQIEKFNASEDWKKVQQVFKTVTARATEGKYGQDPKIFFENATQSINQLFGIVQGDLVQVESHIQTAKSEAEHSMWWVSLSILILLFFIGFIAIAVIRAITIPVQQAVNELGESAKQVTGAFEQLRSASHQISSGAAQSASSLEETVASVEEISGMVTTNANAAQEATKLSRQGYDLALTGEEAVRKLMVSMNELSGSSKEMEAIISIIDDISFQINLLALNAAVEAARAGEHGKGFAVVADAVRQLAQKSAVAAHDIGALIKESVTKTQDGYQAASSSGEALRTIVEAVKNTSSLIQEISNSSQEQAKGLGQITKAMNELDSSTQSNAASAEQTTASAEALSEQANLMQDLVGRLNEIIKGRAS